MGLSQQNGSLPDPLEGPWSSHPLEGSRAGMIRKLPLHNG